MLHPSVGPQPGPQRGRGRVLSQGQHLTALVHERHTVHASVVFVGDSSSQLGLPQRHL